MSKERYTNNCSAFFSYVKSRPKRFPQDLDLDFKHLRLEILALWNLMVQPPYKTVNKNTLVDLINEEMKKITSNEIEFWLGEKGMKGSTFQFQELFDDLIVKEIDSEKSRNIDMIIYMGSGWGRHILMSRLLDNDERNIHYIAADFIEKGNMISRFLPEYYNINMNISEVMFDFNDPNLYSIDFKNKSVLILSVHSMEQITYHRDDFFDEIIGQTSEAQSVYGLHIEPISFLIPEFCEKMPDDAKNEHDFVNSIKLNKNLWQVLLGSNSIKLTQCIPGYIAEGRLSRSVIRWRRK